MTSQEERITELRLQLQASQATARHRAAKIDYLRQGLDAWEKESGRWERLREWGHPANHCAAPEREVPC